MQLIFPASSVSGGSCWCQARPSAAWRRLMKTPLGELVGGTRLIEQLPHPNTKRWVVRRKAAVVAAVRSGGITIEEACRVYQLSKEEFLSWESRVRTPWSCWFARYSHSAVSPSLVLHNFCRFRLLSRGLVELLCWAVLLRCNFLAGVLVKDRDLQEASDPRRNSSPPLLTVRIIEKLRMGSANWPASVVRRLAPELLQLAASFERRADYFDGLMR